MKSCNMARTREIVRTVKNSRFGTPERTMNNREAYMQSKKQSRSRAKYTRAQPSTNKTHRHAHVKPIAKQKEHQTMRQQGVGRKQKVKF